MGKEMVRSAVAPWADAVPESAESLAAADLSRLPDDARGYELVEGRLVRMTPTGTGHAADASTFDHALSQFVRERRLGRVISSEAGFLVSQSGVERLLAPGAGSGRRDFLALAKPIGACHESAALVARRSPPRLGRLADE